MEKCCLLRKDPPTGRAGFQAIAAPPFDVAELFDAADGRRSKIWELALSLHCSIVGACLTAAELRQVFVRFGSPDARTASDHVLHARGVRAASRREEGGKLIHKALDKRHVAAIRRFGRAATPDALRALWTQALDHGDIAGPYWALVTHPAADNALIQDAFGDVHMLSHQIGAAARLDIARLRQLERDLGARDEAIARQQARLQAAAREREALRAALAREDAARAGRNATPEPEKLGEPDVAMLEALRRQLADERAHGAALAEKCRLSEARRIRAEAQVAETAARLAEMRRELAALEAAMRPSDAHEPANDSGEALRGLRALYVGGRPKLIEQLRALVAARGGDLIAHDGGVEDNPALLPGLVAQADVVYFPVDCVSHGAVEQVKRLCRRLEKPWRPLRSASLASFVAQIATAPEAARRPLIEAAE